MLTGLLLVSQGLGAALAVAYAGKLTDRYGAGPVSIFSVATDRVTCGWL
jgi:MFS family permease